MTNLSNFSKQYRFSRGQA